MLSVIANVLTGVAIAASGAVSPLTLWFTWDESDCPEELINL